VALRDLDHPAADLDARAGADQPLSVAPGGDLISAGAHDAGTAADGDAPRSAPPGDAATPSSEP
jgi:hypothetical protein